MGKLDEPYLKLDKYKEEKRGFIPMVEHIQVQVCIFAASAHTFPYLGMSMQGCAHMHEHEVYVQSMRGPQAHIYSPPFAHNAYACRLLVSPQQPTNALCRTPYCCHQSCSLYLEWPPVCSQPPISC